MSKPMKDEGEAAARAFDREYSESHPTGPYQPVEVKPRGASAGGDNNRG